MTMTRDKIEELKRITQAAEHPINSDQIIAYRDATLPKTILSLLALAERALNANPVALSEYDARKPMSPALQALIESGQVEDGDADLAEPQGQALPVAEVFHYDGITYAELREPITVKPGDLLYASQLALPAGPVPEGVQPVGTVVLEWKETDHQEYDKVRAVEWFGPCSPPEGTLLYTGSPAVAQPVADERVDPIRQLIALHADELEGNDYAYFELARHRSTDWMAWICTNVIDSDPTRKVLAKGQGDTPDEACAAAIADYRARAALCQPAEEGDKA